MKPELAVLIAARAKIADPEKWGQGMRGTWDTTRRCASEAIADATSNEFLFAAAQAALRNAAGIKFITTWNDALGRTHAQVLAAFDKAIASAS